ncbi:MAG: sugar phosphate isomerase/epimerase [Oscillospiraceae bacterium]|nr:sugar phosphate isomerase/epimerase [Oscillospiraceae bacterium]
MQNIILCSTGTFIHTWNGRDHTLIEKFMPKLLYQGFEIFMFDYYANNPNEYDDVAKTVLAAKENGADFSSMHTQKSIGELISRNETGDIENALRLFEWNCGYAVKFGVKLLVLHLWGGAPSDKHIGVNIKTFAKLKEISDKYNLILTVENIVCNTSKPLAHMKKLWEIYRGDIKFTIDVRQAEFHKSLIETCESSFLWDNNLVSHLHIADFGGGYMDWSQLRVITALGQGNVDFDYFFGFLKSINYQGSIAVESGYGQETSYDDMINDSNKSYKFIKDGLT